MTERPAHRVVETFYAKPKTINKEILPPVSGKRVIHVSDSEPTNEDLAALQQASDMLSSRAQGGYDRDFALFVSIAQRLEHLRTGRLSRVLSRIGLDSLIPYTPNIEPAPEALPPSAAEYEEIQQTQLRMLDNIDRLR